ncbi:DinB family protein [Alkalihalobacillus sp. 1P02AB]|uniref:DinB family protein n=1 Tax=Alkalihalobacillus sp. 1P02AB TaxID=3132260 RepID=UPI0039A606CB
MILDLKGESEMDAVIGRLYSMVDGNYQRLKSIVAGMSQEELEYKGPNQNFNSTAQLLRHLAYVDLRWVFRIKGEVIPIKLEEKYGPMLDGNNQLPELKAPSLTVLLNEYDEVISMIKSLCYQLKDEHLNQIVKYKKGNEATVQWGIWHIADHSRYHQAHINQLRKWYSDSCRVSE